MILDRDKQEAWFALYERIVRGQAEWPNRLTQEQIDYLMTQLHRNAFPGMEGRGKRSVFRWNCLELAFEIVKARNPGATDKKTFEDVAKHYGCHWATVRKARVKMRDQDFSFARRHRELGFADQDFAEMTLPHIIFDAYTEE